jgi:hypothetical protein
MAQERHSLSNAFRIEISFEVGKNLKWVSLLVLHTFPRFGIGLSKLDLKNAFTLYISSKKGEILSNK